MKSHHNYVHSDFKCVISFFVASSFWKKNLPTSLSEVVDLFHWSLVLTDTLIYGTLWRGHGL